MTRSLPRLACALALCAAAALASAAEIDPGASQIGFVVRTRWGRVLQGRFPEYRGEVSELADGRHRVHLSLATRSVEIVGHQLMLGEPAAGGLGLGEAFGRERAVEVGLARGRGFGVGVAQQDEFSHGWGPGVVGRLPSRAQCPAYLPDEAPMAHAGSPAGPRLSGLLQPGVAAGPAFAIFAAPTRERR